MIDDQGYGVWRSDGSAFLNIKPSVTISPTFPAVAVTAQPVIEPQQTGVAVPVGFYNDCFLGREADLGPPTGNRKQRRERERLERKRSASK